MVVPPENSGVTRHLGVDRRSVAGVAGAPPERVTSWAPRRLRGVEVREHPFQRRRVDGQSNNELSSHSPERNSYPQSANRQSIHALTNTSDILGPLTGMGGARYSPVNLPSSVRSSVDLTNNLGSVYGDTQSQADSSILEDDEHVEGEEGITDGVGQLSINEEAQVRFHGKASGLHILGQKIRPDGRNKGGIW